MCLRSSQCGNVHDYEPSNVALISHIVCRFYFILVSTCRTNVWISSIRCFANLNLLQKVCRTFVGTKTISTVSNIFHIPILISWQLFVRNVLSLFWLSWCTLPVVCVVPSSVQPYIINCSLLAAECISNSTAINVVIYLMKVLHSWTCYE